MLVLKIIVISYVIGWFATFTWIEVTQDHSDVDITDSVSKSIIFPLYWYTVFKDMRKKKDQD